MLKVKDFMYSLATDKYRGRLSFAWKPLFYLLSLFYGITVGVLSFLKGIRPVKLACKVISVGNITLGGTGKTPLVALIAEYLTQNGHKVAILSRGYKMKAGQGDEPAMLLDILPDIPVIVDKDRIRGAQKAIRDYSADTVILDDGFQQWGVSKDLEILTIDACCPFGNFHLIPRGIMRERFFSLRRADIFVLTKTNWAGKEAVVNIRHSLNRVNPAAAVFSSSYVPVYFYELGREGLFLDTRGFKDKAVVLASGIAQPDSFLKMAGVLGMETASHIVFNDHHHYSPQDINRIIEEAKKAGVNTVITTEKDAAKFLPYLFIFHEEDIKVLALRIQVKINEDEQGFYNRLLGVYTA